MPVDEHRQELLQSDTAMTVEQLADVTGMPVDETAELVEKLAGNGRLVAVPHDGHVLIPTFQLDEHHGLDWQLSSRTRRLVAWGLGPWALWDWWQTPNAWLTDGRSPADAARDGDLDAVDHAIDGMMQ